MPEDIERILKNDITSEAQKFVKTAVAVLLEIEARDIAAGIPI